MVHRRQTVSGAVFAALLQSALCDFIVVKECIGA